MATVIQDTSALELLIQEQRDLLDTVDDLRSLGVGRIVDLPQIIVVGDQSSGKSSVLEAISLVRFPVKGGLCTRFATELVLRKSQATNFEVSIIAGKSSEDLGQSRVASIKRFNETIWNHEDLSNVIEEATKAMGIGNSAHEFSDHILRIEISKPEVPSLTLIDLPGFYHGETSEQSAKGRKTVTKLAKRYMARKNSIILAIISGSYGLANQNVLNKARQYDPGHLDSSLRDPERTLGILTKPDTIAKGTDDEDKYLQLIQNKEKANKLKLGWHVLRNRAGDETNLSGEDRDAREADFLSQGVWRNIRPGDKGIKSLRSKLSKVLVDHIKKSLPDVRRDIERSIEEKSQSLKELGTPRSSPEQIRQYLGEISGKILQLTTDGVRGTGYRDPFFGDLGYQWSLAGGVFQDARRLRAVVRNLNETFAAVMKGIGETRSVVWNDDKDSDEDDDENDDENDDEDEYDDENDDENDDEDEDDDENDDENDYEDEDDDENDDENDDEDEDDDENDDETDDEDEDEDNGGDDDGDHKWFGTLPKKLLTIVREYDVPVPIPIDISELEDEMRSLALENLGSQFPGSPNDDLALQLFKDQSRKWEVIAKQHLRLISAAAKSFTEAVVSHAITADDKTREAILVEIVDPFFCIHDSEMDSKLGELLQHYQTGIPQPLDEEYLNELSSRTKKRIAKNVAYDLAGKMKISLQDVAKAILDAEDKTNEYTKVIDMMSAYYKLSLRTFTENVRILAAENCLISVIPRIFTPEMVNRMDDDRLVALAAESEDIREDRELLREQLEVLKEGLEKCRRFGGRHSNSKTSLILSWKTPDD